MNGNVDLPTLALYLSLTFLCYICIYYCSSRYNVENGKLYIQYRMLFLLLIGSMVIVATCRSASVGTDTEGYIERFRTYRFNQKIEWLDFIKLQGTEPVYFYFTVFINTITDNFHLYFLFIYLSISIGFCGFLYLAYREYKCYFYKEKLLAFLPIILMMTYYIHSFSVMRNWLSISIALWAFVFLSEEKYGKSLFLIILSGLFHYTAFSLIIVWVYLFFGKNKRIITNQIWLILFSVFLVAILFGSITTINLFMKNTRYSSYEGRVSNFISILPSIIILIGSIAFSKDIKKQGKFGKMCVSCIPIQVFFLFAGQFGASRINYYFSFHYIYLISLIYGCTRKISKLSIRFFFRLLIVCFVIALYVRNIVMYSESSGVFPYIFEGFNGN